MNNFTKGEWEYKRPQIGTPRGIICNMIEPHFMPDCGDVTWYNGQVEVMEANAHLIAAAPELYEALESIMETINYNHSQGYDSTKIDYKSSFYNKAQEALAKANGEGKQ